MKHRIPTDYLNFRGTMNIGVFIFRKCKYVPNSVWDILRLNKYLLFICNSNVSGLSAFLFATSSNLLWEGQGRSLRPVLDSRKGNRGERKRAGGHVTPSPKLLGQQGTNHCASQDSLWVQRCGTNPGRLSAVESREVPSPPLVPFPRPLHWLGGVMEPLLGTVQWGHLCKVLDAP